MDSELQQKVYIPIKKDRVAENVVELKQGELIFEQVIKPVHKYNYFKKIKEITSSLIEKNVHENIDFIHAHNLFTDGVIAYNLKKKFGIKYIVAIRTTDIELQYKYMYHRRARVKKVLEDAEQIIFISPNYRDKFLTMLSESFIARIKNKIKIVPNGIDDFWLNNQKKPTAKSLEKKVHLLYVGQIMQRKNVFPLMEAINLLNTKKGEEKYDLTIIGGANTYEKEFYNSFLSTIKQFNWVKYKGVIKDKKMLLQEYRNCDIFAMPAKGELFGLVYIEALSQGKPVIYAKGEGINGFLEGKQVGKSVDPDDLEDICDGIIYLKENYISFNDFSEVVEPFNWNRIANLYKSMYQKDEQD
ncbi:glycosyltransferase family 4 protein [Maribacter sp. 4G9]|uniref:glycosyltransferase family 4 protein n=1 Tax=Maribacter sp. 4G9 TaxID=1889777 RepID=UPI0013FE46EB|nr:glycosyltransferase family 4 protein [Maribacter sp. 4G9]